MRSWYGEEVVLFWSRWWSFILLGTTGASHKVLLQRRGDIEGRFQILGVSLISECFETDFCFYPVRAIYHNSMHPAANHSVATVSESSIKKEVFTDLSSNASAAELIEPSGLLFGCESSDRCIKKIFGFQWFTASRERNNWIFYNQCLKNQRLQTLTSTDAKILF